MGETERFERGGERGDREKEIKREKSLNADKEREGEREKKDREKKRGKKREQDRRKKREKNNVCGRERKITPDWLENSRGPLFKSKKSFLQTQFSSTVGAT